MNADESLGGELVAGILVSSQPNLSVKSILKQQFLAPLDNDEWNELQRSVVDKEPSPEQNLLQKEKLNLLRKAIGRLTPVECLNLRTIVSRTRSLTAGRGASEEGLAITKSQNAE